MNGFLTNRRRTIALSILFFPWIAFANGDLDKEDARSNGNGGFSSAAYNDRNVRSATDQGVNNADSWTQDQQKEYSDDGGTIDSAARAQAGLDSDGNRTSGTSSSSSGDNGRDDGSTGTTGHSQTSISSEPTDPWEGYKENVEGEFGRRSGDYNAHVDAYAEASAYATANCSGGCTDYDYLVDLNREYYKTLSDSHANSSLPKGPMASTDHFFTQDESITNEDPFLYPEGLIQTFKDKIDEGVRSGIFDVIMPGQASQVLSDEFLNTMNNTHVLGSLTSPIVIDYSPRELGPYNQTTFEALWDVYIGYPTGQPLAGDTSIGGILMPVTRSPSGVVGIITGGGPIRSIVLKEELFHSGQLAIRNKIGAEYFAGFGHLADFDRIDDLGPAYRNPDGSLKTSVLNTISNVEDMYSGFSVHPNDCRRCGVLSRDPYTGSLVEITAKVSTGVDEDHIIDEIAGSLRSSLGISMSRGRRVARDVLKSEAIQDIIDDMNEMAGIMIENQE